MAIIMSPGTTNCIYVKPPISPIREPISEPKITKYSDMVIAEGNRVWVHIRR